MIKAIIVGMIEYRTEERREKDVPYPILSSLVNTNFYPLPSILHHIYPISSTLYPISYISSILYPIPLS